jgi:outer membrane cobalamin receptor
VLDPQARPVAGATVVASSMVSAPVAVISSADGRFDFAGLAEGHYDFTASVPGLLGEKRAVAVASSPVTLDIMTRVSAMNETLVVSAGQVDQPLSRIADSVTVVTRQELAARQLTSLGAALTGIPGFTIARSGGAGTVTSLFPRGGDSDFTLVLVDGVRANAFGGSVDLSQVPLADVDRIEVVRGPQSALYGADAIGGVVQVITRQDGPPTASAHVELGGRDSRRAHAASSGALGRLRWQVGADYFAEEGFAGIAPASGERVTNDDAETWQGWIGGGWRAPRGTDLQASFRYVDTERGAPGPYGSDPARRFSGVDRVSRGNTERRATALRLTHPWTGPASRVRQRVEFDTADYDLTFVSPFGTSTSETRRTHVRVQTDAALDAGWGVSGGVEWLDEAARSSFIQSAGAEVPVERRVIGTFGEARWNAHDRFSLQAGVRAEHITRDALVVNSFAADRVTSVNPKVSMSWVVSRSAPSAGAGAWTRLHAAAGTGIRPPDVFEIAFTDNPALKPERSRSVEGGVRQAFVRGAVQLDATAFVNRYDDLIISVGSLRDVSRYRTDNVSNARSTGMEVGGAWQSLVGFGVRASYTWLDTEIRAIDRTAQAPSPYSVGDPLIRRPRHNAFVAVQVTRQRWTAFGSVDARGRTLDVEPAFGPTGGVFPNRGRAVVDVGGSVRLAQRLEAFARILNAADGRYEDVLGFPAPRRTAFAGVRLVVGR